jgi:Tfp pilus assembly PilM family ATPase
MLVARANGAVKPVHQLAAELPEDAVRAGLQGPNLPDPGPVADVLRGLAEEADARRERSGMVAVLIPDAAVRMALVPLEEVEPKRAEGDAMARWALSGLLPVETGNARVDWSVIAAESVEPAAKWLLVVGADAAVVREYESVVEGIGWIPGRVVPLTMALAVGADDTMMEVDPGAARIVLSGVGGQVACLVEADGVPRFHRAWRGAAPDLVLELPAIQRYVQTRLDLSIVDAVIAGPEAWRQRAATDCEALGWKVRVRSSWSAHIGAVQP